MSRLQVFRERLPTTAVIRSALFLVILCVLAAVLLPRERIWVGLTVLVGVLAIPYLALPTLFRLSPQFIRVTEWVPVVAILGMVLLRKAIASDFRLGLLLIAIAGLYLGCYFWLFSDFRFWAVMDELNKEHE